MVAALFPQVRLVRNGKRLLYARNHNIGMKMSRARYACHLDSDTLLREQRAWRLGLLHGRESRCCGMRPQTVKRRRIGATLHSKFHRCRAFLLQALNWHKMFPRSRVMNRYYNTDFDYSSAQSVQSIGTSAYIVRRSTWEQIGMFDERFGQFMVDLAYNFTLQRQGFPVYYTPCAEIVHYGSRSIRPESCGRAARRD